MRLGSRGLRDLDGGVEPIPDEGARAQVRAQARAVLLQSLTLAIALTGLALLLPVRF